MGGCGGDLADVIGGSDLDHVHAGQGHRPDDLADGS